MKVKRAELARMIREHGLQPQRLNVPQSLQA
jgi:hypothetical protein